MLPHLTNTAGLWALLGIPLILAIHFLQHRTRVRLTATMFLLESLAPEAATGRNWDRLRSSRALWLQLLAVLLLAWVLAAPCWVRQDAEQTVVFIMDDSANMYPFREEAVQAVAEDMENIGKQGIPTTWVLMGSRPARLPFYRGNNRNAALQSLSRWMPDAATHDLSESLRTAASMAGAGGLTRLVTCTPERVPAGQPARGVGKPLDNAGFAGITRMEGPGEPRWRIAVKNNSAAPVQKSVSIRAGDVAQEQSLTLHPGAVAEFEYTLPPGCGTAVLRLAPDAFPLDDVLPLVRPTPKPVAVEMQVPEKTADVFRKIYSGLPGFSSSPSTDSTAALRILVEDKADAHRPHGAAIILGRLAEKSSGIRTVTEERHPLTDGLNWSGLLVPGTGSMAPGENATMLLWRENTPLAWLEEGALFLNWSWEDSNADRLPATVLMVRRFMEAVQARVPGVTTGNLPGGTRLRLPGGSRIIHTAPDGERKEASFSGRLPEEPGFIDITGTPAETTPLFHGAVWFSDARMGDFSHCSTFDSGLQDLKQETRRHLAPDPLAPLWLALAGLALMASWIPSTPNTLRRP